MFELRKLSLKWGVGRYSIVGLVWQGYNIQCMRKGSVHNSVIVAHGYIIIMI